MRTAALLLVAPFTFAAACARPPATRTETANGPGAPHEPHWVATWGASPQRADTDESLKVAGQTIREIVRVSLGGARLRVRLSNAFGAGPVVVGDAQVALHATGPAATSGRALRFGGASSVTIPAGGVVVSDPVTLAVASLSELAVSLYVPEAVTLMTEHSSAQETTYVSRAGNVASAETLVEPTTTASWYLLAGIDVERAAGEAVVVLGDSLTDGDRSTRDANRRWTDRLAERLEPTSRSVVNEGMSGNRLLHDHESFGKSGLARFDVDVLDQPGARYVIVAEGLNDIGMPRAFDLPGEEVTAEEIIGAHRRLVERAHARGLRIFGATLPPYEGAQFKGYYTPEGDAKRAVVNAWMRTSKAYDAVIDFDAILRDPDHPSRLRPAYASVDHIHPNDDGYRALGDAIALSIFDAERAAPR